MVGIFIIEGLVGVSTRPGFSSVLSSEAGIIGAVLFVLQSLVGLNMDRYFDSGTLAVFIVVVVADML
jgi:hypothetical protein